MSNEHALIEGLLEDSDRDRRLVAEWDATLPRDAWTLREADRSEPGEGHEWHLDLHGEFEWRSAVVVYGMEGPDKHDAEGYARALAILAFLNGGRA